MYKIGICGAHGTGKTTLGNLLAHQLYLPFITNTMRSMWLETGVSDFEKLPPDIRTEFQKYAIARQINRENTEGLNGFVTDRTVVDNLGYTKLSSNMSGVDLQIYKLLAIERLKNYSTIIYLPIMFEVENDPKRAKLETRNTLANIIETEILELIQPNKLLQITTLDNSDRIRQILDFLNS